MRFEIRLRPDDEEIGGSRHNEAEIIATVKRFVKASSWLEAG
jgi:hypothetical protein